MSLHSRGCIYAPAHNTICCILSSYLPSSSVQSPSRHPSDRSLPWRTNVGSRKSRGLAGSGNRARLQRSIEDFLVSPNESPSAHRLRPAQHRHPHPWRQAKAFTLPRCANICMHAYIPTARTQITLGLTSHPYLPFPVPPPWKTVYKTLQSSLGFLPIPLPLPSPWIASPSTVLPPKSLSRTFANKFSSSKPISPPRVSNSQAVAFIYVITFPSYRPSRTARPRATSRAPLKPRRPNPPSSRVPPSNPMPILPLCGKPMIPPRPQNGLSPYATGTTP